MFTKENAEDWLIKNRLESMKNKIAWKIFFRKFGRWLLFAFSFLIPVWITVYTGTFAFLFLVLPLFFLWWKFAQWKATFIEERKCLICHGDLTINERIEDENTNYYINCKNCNKDILAYTIPVNHSFD